MYLKSIKNYHFSDSQDDDFDENIDSASSDELANRRGRRQPVRRSSRARISRYDRDFSKTLI